METAQTRSGRRSRARRAGRLPMQDRPGANANARVPFRGVAHEPACPFSRLWPGTHRPLHAVAGAHRASPAALVVRDVPFVLCRRARWTILELRVICTTPPLPHWLLQVSCRACPTLSCGGLAPRVFRSAIPAGSRLGSAGPVSRVSPAESIGGRSPPRAERPRARPSRCTNHHRHCVCRLAVGCWPLPESRAAGHFDYYLPFVCFYRGSAIISKPWAQ